MIALALGRFLARTPWSSAMALFGVTLGVISIVSVHLISASISQRLDGLVPIQLAGFSHFLHRSDIASSHYFELRRAWRKGQLKGVTAIAPLIDETTDIEGSAVRVIGVDGDGPELGDALHVEIVVRVDQGDEGCESHEGHAETGEERGHRLREVQRSRLSV